MDTLFAPLNRLSGYAHWALRVGVAGIFLYHGLTKFPALSGMAQMMGMPVFMLLLVALAETGAGILILVGGFLPDWVTRLGALLILPPMLGAVMMVHWGQWAFVASETHPMGGMEFQVFMILVAVYFLLKGNGVNQTVTTAAA